jgi:hypothetical protein
MVFWTVFITEISLAIFFAIYQAQADNRNVFQLLTASFIIFMLLFSIISGIVVIVTIKTISASDPKLFFRTAVQLVILSSVVSGKVLFSVVFFFFLLKERKELCAALALIIGSTIVVSTSTFPVAYGLSTIFPQVVQFLLMGALILQSRIYVWQLKEVAAKRPVTRISSKGKTLFCFCFFFKRKKHL